MNVIWHDLECGGYAADMPLWRTLAARYGDPVLDVGAGTGRIALDLAQAGHRVTALDLDPELLAELARRADGLGVETIVADARDFDLRRRFALCVMPMQTIQLLGGRVGRMSFLRCARTHLSGGGVLAIALTETLELYEVVDGTPAPLPDIIERAGVVYSSQPTAVRAERDGFVLERRRETITVDGRRSVQQDAVRLDQLSAAGLRREAVEAGFSVVENISIPATSDYVGSEVVIVRA
jgi:SAM-dependent methyltransferase